MVPVLLGACSRDWPRLQQGGRLRFNRGARLVKVRFIHSCGGFMKRNVVPVLSAVAVIATFSAAVIAQEMKPDRAIKYRQGILQAMGWNMGTPPRRHGRGCDSLRRGSGHCAQPRLVHGLSRDAVERYPASRLRHQRPTKAKPRVKRAEQGELPEQNFTFQSSRSRPRSWRQRPRPVNPGAIARHASGHASKACFRSHDDFHNK